MRSRTHTTAAAAGALAAVALMVTAPPATAAGARDVTADVLADRDVTLTGDTPGPQGELALRYRGGDGNDVVLSAVAARATPSTRASAASGAEAPLTEPRTASTASSGLGWWPYVLAVGLLIGLVAPAALRRKDGPRRGGRHGARG